ncbi:FAD:protein FMN transferase [Limnohabitans sp. Jir72]|uniref:FAD:protein FMN transferase n=1 Tax=Limnohabitans sp. Jir72 TaxID=1977909 RepID=UPI000D3821C4|nr:FAD:protein FMN transferase [Limnohabitans sp. Jir72]PUE33502.1 ApbE family lipoprotein [Limnohabitans sp. Jir72]
MKRRAFIQSAWGLGGLAPFSVQASPAVTPRPLIWRETHFTGLGTLLSIRAAHAHSATLEAALAAARQTVERIEDQMSLFRPDSAISRLNREGQLSHPAPELLALVQRSQQIAQQSRGAFDITVQPLWQLYARAQAQGRLPSAREVQATRQKVGWQHLHITPERMAFARPGMGITLNGIAQGHAADRVREVLQAHGIAHALVNTGEWAPLGQSPAGQDWVLGVANPRAATPADPQVAARLALQGRCLATSADDASAFTPDRQHHHIFNPHTGLSPPDIASVTVAAPDCTLADALTKVLFVAGYARALAVARVWQADALVIHKTGRLQSSAGLQRLAV